MSTNRQIGQPVIQVTDLSYSVGKRPILQGIDFSIKKNDFVLIFGRNGAGKSTLLRILSGMLPVQTGEVLIAGRNMDSYSKRELATLLSFLPQSTEFDLPILVRDVLHAGRYPYRIGFKKFSDRDLELISEGIEYFNLGDLLLRNMQTLSGGERKKVLLATAFIQDVPVFLLDEPLNFLDPGSTVHLLEMLDRLHHKGKTIVLVSHEIDCFFPFANKILALKDGNNHYFGKKVFSPELFREIYQVSYGRTWVGKKELIFVDE